MKTIKIPLSIFSFLLAVYFFPSCSKETTEASKDCRTCKALNANGSTASQQQVCNEGEETSFRNANPGKEITCN